ncbi:DegT/DnrJ/EryC1/StrS family aminotransferase [Oleiharenicola sp. Vm1]|uniref:DegT/DnrJ/EryC1/StrS family aminotransferase n=1 Tax=Oleiharenicola sp. Vm1 TaxID=3398393 RepID=UPI0039F52250
MKIPFVDLYAQYLSIRPELDAAIAAVIKESGFVRSRFVDEFEQQWARTLGVKHCVSCANGTDALYILMRGLGLKPGDEVITTAHSWIATSETITQAGGKVVFCDTEDDTFTIDPAAVAAKITPRTVGIIPVHLCGQPADMDPLMALAQKHNLWVIEDCAQAHLATYKGRLVGTLGHAATFSFYPGKNLGAMGDAGCLVTNDTRLAEWSTLFARHGGKGDHVMEGINSRLDGLHAAVLSAKLPHLAGWTQRRQELAATYTMKLAGAGDVRCPVIRADRTHVFHLYMIRTKQRDALRAHLQARGIATVLNYPRALPLYPAYGYLKHQPADFPRAATHQGEILSLPLYPEMTGEALDYVVASIREFYAR